MRGDIECFGLVALGAQGVAFRPRRKAVRFMAIAADDTGTVHLALRKGTVFIHFAVDLAIGVVGARFQQRGGVVVEKRSARLGRFGNLPPSGMARKTGVDAVTG